MASQIIRICFYSYVLLVAISCTKTCVEDISVDPVRVSVVGASISTYKGYVGNNNSYYPRGDVLSVDSTWWMQLSNKKGFVFYQNNSWSGGRITSTHKTYPSLISLVESLDDTDCLLLVGGYNDFNNNVPIGLSDYSCAYDSLNDMQFAQAYDKYLRAAMRKSPQVYCIILMGITTKYAEVMIQTASYYQLPIIDLREIEDTIEMYDFPHPSAHGMQTIANYCYERISSNMGI
ncbi:MAG: hypothetical protein J5374_10570 [Bacteroidales bacterium]|nr:hypothetical protein [Bacteroidales bacterium]